jgi:hypothetical protein
VVRIADRIWPAWREQADRFEEPVLLVLFSPAGDHATAAGALRDSVLEVQDAYRAEAERAGDPDPPFTGEWAWVRVSDGVLVQVAECDVLEEVLPAVAAALERRGIDGAFDRRDAPAVAMPPHNAHLLECRVRVRGERLRRGPGDYLWQADPGAHEAILGVAERWCRRRGYRVAQSLSSSTLAPVRVEPDEDVVDRMRETVADRLHVEVCAVTEDEFRIVAARAWSGGVSLIEGGAWVAAGDWQRALAELTRVLRDNADRLAYGYVKRGWAVTQARLDDALPHDWPERPDYRPRGIGFTAEAFEDLYAPDAFAVQLLGPGYAGRIPDAAGWWQEPVGTASVLLEHVDLPAWFDAPFVPFRHRARPTERPQPPAVLAEARVELAPILYTRGALSRLDFADAEQ